VSEGNERGQRERAARDAGYPPFDTIVCELIEHITESIVKAIVIATSGRSGFTQLITIAVRIDVFVDRILQGDHMGTSLRHGPLLDLFGSEEREKKRAISMF
jgi:hypothetical protein